MSGFADKMPLQGITKNRRLNTYPIYLEYGHIYCRIYFVFGKSPISGLHAATAILYESPLSST